MAHYLYQAAYTSEAWATMVKNPQNRMEAVQPVIEKLGGSVENGWFAFGEYDVALIVKMPDNISAAALSVAISAGGSVKAAKTTPLLTTEEAVTVMRKAGTAGYKPPR